MKFATILPGPKGTLRYALFMYARASNADADSGGVGRGCRIASMIAIDRHDLFVG